MKKIKILFLINTLGGGGAERALVNLVNNLNQDKYDITVETMFGDGVNLSKIKSGIKYVSKNAPCPKGISKIIKLFPAKILFKYFIGNDKYDILVAYMHGIPVKVISGNKNVKRLAWLHNGSPETSTMFSPWILKRTAFNAYANCDAVVGVCESVANAFSDYTSVKDNVIVAYNTLDTFLIDKLSNEAVDIDSEQINIVSTGRLGKEKGYSRLLDVCKLLKTDGYEFSLYLIGAGSEEDKLKTKTAELGLSDNVVFLGFQENPYKYLNKCDIFVCSSYTEGLSTATIEALVLGKAIVSTDVSGAYEIIGDNEYGIIVENSNEGLYNGLKLLLSDNSLVDEYKSKALKRKEYFSVKNTVNRVESIIDGVLNS